MKLLEVVIGGSLGLLCLTAVNFLIHWIIQNSQENR